jgi:hypothetical protein
MCAMRSPLGKLLRKELEQRLLSAYPEFRRSPELWSDPLWGYVREVSPELSFYVALQIHQRRDSFNFSVGFGEGGKRPPFDSPRRAEAMNKPALFRLSLLKADFAPDVWWHVDPGEAETFGPSNPMAVQECAARIPALLDDALAQLAEYAIPFFHEVARLRGIGIVP